MQSDGIITPEWKAVALTAYQGKLDTEERERAKREAEEAAKLKELLSAVGIEADPTTGEIVVDDIHFAYYNYYGLVILENCPDCDEQIRSQSVTAPVHLGEWIMGKHRTYHHCSAKSQESPDAPAERLVTALCDLIYDQIDNFSE